VAGVIVAFDGWNASGVGWGEQGWGEGVGNLTATTAVGTITVFAQTTATVLVTGNAATAELGDEVIVATAIVIEDGVEGTGQIGTVSVAAEAPFAVTGVSASVEICGGWGVSGFGESGWGGCVVVIGDANVFEDAVSATGAIGTVSFVLDCKFPVTGVAGTGELGNVGFPVTVEITGVEAQVILSDEVVVADAVVIEDGVAGTGALGTVTVYGEYIALVTGVSATGAVGTVTTESAYGVTGVSATGQIGTIIIHVDYLVTGVSATGSIGAQTPAVNVWGLIDTNQNANWTQIAA
jgi:hypothetical protein